MFKSFLLELNISAVQTNYIFSVNSNDLNTIRLDLVIKDNAALVDLTGKIVRLAIRKPDNTVVFQSGGVTDGPGGKCEFILSKQASLVAGRHEAEVMIYEGDSSVAVTTKFYYEVKRAALSNSDVESSSDFPAISQAIAAGEILKEIDIHSVIEAGDKVAGIQTQLDDARQKEDGTLFGTVQERLNDTDEKIVSNAVKSTENALEIGDKQTLPAWLQESLREVSKRHDDHLREFGINVRQPPYNAKGNGRDVNKADDLIPIQNAINDAYAQKRPVYFPPGFYYVSDSLVLPANITLIGSNYYWTGAGTPDKWECTIDSAASKVFVGSTPGTATNHFACVLNMSNLCFNGKVNTLFDFFHMSGANIKENMFYNFDVVLRGSMGMVSEMHHNHFLNIKTSVLTNKTSVTKAAMTDSKIHHNYISGVAQGTAILLDCDGANYSEITNNFFDYAYTCVRLDVSTTLMSVQGNVFDICLIGIDFKSGGSSQLSNNQFGKVTMTDHTLFSALSTGDRTLFSTTPWIGIKVGMGANNLTMQGNSGYRVDTLIDIQSFGNHRIRSGGNTNAFSTGVIVKYNKTTDANNINDGKEIVIEEMNDIVVSTLPTNNGSFTGQRVWYQGKLCVRKAGNRDVKTLTITAGATATGDVSVTLNGTTKTVAVVAGDSAAVVASKIQAVTFTGIANSVNGAVVTYTANLAGTSGANSFSPGSTGVAGSLVTTTAGTADYWTDAMNNAVS